MQGCGLVMKEDITQLLEEEVSDRYCCGLVMKEDITQRMGGYGTGGFCCGLVMKEDITQHIALTNQLTQVVVW